MTPAFAPAFPWIASGVAALLGLLGVVLAVRVIMNRVRLGIEIGDGAQQKWRKQSAHMQTSLSMLRWRSYC